MSQVDEDHEIVYLKEGLSIEEKNEFIKSIKNLKNYQIRGRCSLIYKISSSSTKIFCIKRVIEEDQFAPHSILREIKAYELIKERKFFGDLLIAFSIQEDSFTTLIDLILPWYSKTLKDVISERKNFNSNLKLFFIQTVKDLFSALNYLHSIDIAHRDIKPENIMISKENRIKLIDFGTCWFFNSNSDSKGDDGKGNQKSQIGTGSYRPIETLFSPKNGYDAKKIDIWQSSVTLIEFLLPKNKKTLFENEKGDLGLANSIFNLLGLPTLEEQHNWPESEFFQPNLNLMPFKRRLSKEGGLRSELIEINKEDFELQSIIDILESCIQLSSSKRPNANEILNLLKDINVK